MKQNQKNILLASILIIAAASMRVINAEFHLYHLAPVAALGLFSGAIVKDKRLAFMLPLLAMLSADVYFQLFTNTPGFYDISQYFVYAAMFIITMLGTSMGQVNGIKIGGYSIAGSLIFFVISNFGVWASIQFSAVDLYGYGKGFSGLVNTFVAALPFYKNEMATTLFTNSLVGDLIFSYTLFGAYFLAQRASVKSAQQA